MELHIGREIEAKFHESGLKPSEFAKRLNTSTRNVYSIFQREDINGAMLKEISEILGFDFFSLYQKTMAPNLASEPFSEYKNQGKERKKIVMTVELDGLSSTLESWYDIMKKVNSVIT
jgi:hypothetical protein